jgi:NitT/TauT family transport system substrate-binding protein
MRAALTGNSRLLWGGGVLLAVALLGAGLYFFAGLGPTPQPDAPARKITIATTLHAGAAPLYVAVEKGYFKEEGLDVTLAPFTSGKAGLAAVLDSKADFATVAEIPLALAAMQGERIAIVATFFSGARDHKVIARKDRGIAAPLDLKGKKIGATAGTNSAFLLDLVLASVKLSRADVRLVNLKPEEMLAALTKGEVDATSTWQPTLGVLQKALGPNGVMFDGFDIQGIFTVTLNLAGRQEFVKARPETVSKTLRALVRGSEFVRANSDEARRITSAAVGVDEALLREIWDGYRYSVRLDQSLPIALEDTSRWAIKNRLIDARAVPNYSDFIFPDELQRLNPAAVRLIR